MTPVDDEPLYSLVAAADLIMLDFDGPVCSVFAGLPAPLVAERLRRTLGRLGVDLTEASSLDDDPLSIYRYAQTYGARVVDEVHRDLIAAELEAIESATLTPGAAEVMEAAHESHRRVAIVSNNALAAIQAFLRLAQLEARVDYIAARRTAHPGAMKPSPTFLNEALNALRCPPERSILVGDSTTDVDAALSAGVVPIGYANKPGKAQRLKDSGSIAVITQMSDLTGVMLDPRR